MRPPENTDHSDAFKIIFGWILAITAAWAVWCVQAQLSTIPDEPAQLVVP